MIVPDTLGAVAVLFVMVFIQKVEMVEICGVWMKKQ
jgi:hypothetical protein